MNPVRSAMFVAACALGVWLTTHLRGSPSAPAEVRSAGVLRGAPLARAPTSLAVRPIGAKRGTTVSVSPPVSGIANPLVQSDETDHLISALRLAWPTRSEAKRRPQSTTATLPRSRAGNPTAMQRAFDQLPPDEDWKRLRQERPRRPRPRLKRLGVEVAEVECRIGVCRFELEYSGRAADERREQVRRGARVRATDRTLVRTWQDDEGTVRSVIFLARGGTLPLS